MSIHLVSLISHNLKSFSELEDLRNKIQNHKLNNFKLENFAEETFLEYHSDSGRLKWLWEWNIPQDRLSAEETWIKEKEIDLVGPISSLNFVEKICYFSIPIDWASFLIEKKIRANARFAIFDLARELGSIKVIYIPDSSYKSSIAGTLAYEQNNTLETIISELNNICGKSSSVNRIFSLNEAIPNENDIKSIGKIDKVYFVDDFKDLHSLKP